MPLTLSSAAFQFSLNPQIPAWSLFHTLTGTVLENVRGWLVYHLEGKQHTTGGTVTGDAQALPERIQTPNGVVQQVNLFIPPDPAGIQTIFRFLLLENQPLFLWRMEVENRGAQPVVVERLEMLQVTLPGADAFAGNLPKSQTPASRLLHLQPDAFFSNGWQSWSYTGLYQRKDHYRQTQLGFIRAPLTLNSSGAQVLDPGHFGSEMFGVLCDRRQRRGLLAGFLSQQQQFGSLEVRMEGPQAGLRLWCSGDGALLEPGQLLKTDWACLHFLSLDDLDPLSPYLEAVADEHGLEGSLQPPQDSAWQPGRIPAGWCSWYHFKDHIRPKDIRSNLEAASHLKPRIPLEVIQIDDGFQAAAGDWLRFKRSFPQGVAPLASDIREAGFTPGLWLAPFFVARRSRLAHEHPDWLIRGKERGFANAGFAFHALRSAGLDLTHTEALNYVQEIIHIAVHEWGFPYLKLDFLYAAAIEGRRADPHLTRAQVLRRGIEVIRQAAGPEAYLLACGCPLGSAIGLVDAMRIGADVEYRWEPAVNGFTAFLSKEMDIPAMRNAIQNTLTRAPFHRQWWVNDPDPLLLSAKARLTLDEVQSQASIIALSGGPFFLSDDLPDLPPERLHIAQSLIPPIGHRPAVVDLFDQATPQRLRLDLKNASGEWHLLALFNWSDMEKDLELHVDDFQLPGTESYFAREFWSGRSFLVEPGAYLFPKVPAHGVVLLSLREIASEEAVYIGSNLHISQGLEICAWESTPQQLSFSLERPGEAKGEIELFLPRPLAGAEQDGQPVTWDFDGEYGYRFKVLMNTRADFRINYS